MKKASAPKPYRGEKNHRIREESNVDVVSRGQSKMQRTQFEIRQDNKRKCVWKPGMIVGGTCTTTKKR